jgi:hypothetical protein
VQHCEYIGQTNIWKGFCEIGYEQSKNLRLSEHLMEEYDDGYLSYDLPMANKLKGQLTIFAIHYVSLV